ncbi:MAG: phosphoribosylglycinamide formyltransferase [Pseudomonadota bacterium]
MFISGKGSNLAAIIKQIQQKKLNAHINCVISDNPQAEGLIKAKKASIKTHVIKWHTSASKNTQVLKKILSSHQSDLVVLAGFMRILPKAFVTAYRNKIINIHPSLLPKYPGLNTHQRVLNSSDRYHGVSIHFVDEKVDGGPIIAQSSLKIKQNDTPSRLKQRIHKLEHKLYPLIISWFSENRLHLSMDGIKYNNQQVPPQGILIEL